MSRHIIYLPQAAFSADSRLVIRDEEAHHAVRVRRLVAGDHVQLSDGRGTLADACITETRKRGRDGWEVEVAVSAVSHPAPLLPRLTVFAAPPKGDRLSEMIDGLSQTGAAAWRPLASQRAQGDSLAFKAERLERIAAESLKQCSRATLMQIGPTATMDEALAASPKTIIADSEGSPYIDDGAEEIALLIGPEGGWTSDEVALARNKGAVCASFGRHVMRIETAAVVAAGIIIHARHALVR